MTITTFRGLKCDDIDASRWDHHLCTHMRPLIDGDAGFGKLHITKMLVGCNRSAEVFAFVSGELPKISVSALAAISPQLQLEQSSICCNSCWCYLHPGSAL